MGNKPKSNGQPTRWSSAKFTFGAKVEGPESSVIADIHIAVINGEAYPGNAKHNVKISHNGDVSWYPPIDAVRVLLALKAQHDTHKTNIILSAIHQSKDPTAE